MLSAGIWISYFRTRGQMIRAPRIMKNDHFLEQIFGSRS